MSKVIDSGMKRSCMFVELDALFDTRMGTLIKIGTEQTCKALDAGYYDRPFDVFPSLEDNVYRELYSKRDKSTLACSMVTPVMEIMKEFTNSTLENINNSPFHYKPVLILNLYPYVLDDKEVVNIIAGVRAVTRGVVDIEVVNMSYAQLSPLYVSLNVSMMILYDYDKWLETQSVNKAWNKSTCPDVTLIGPRIYMKKPDSTPKLDDIDPFEAMEKLAGPFINLVLLPIDRFSMIAKIERK